MKLYKVASVLLISVVLGASSIASAQVSVGAPVGKKGAELLRSAEGQKALQGALENTALRSALETAFGSAKWKAVEARGTKEVLNVLLKSQSSSDQRVKAAALSVLDQAKNIYRAQVSTIATGSTSTATTTSSSAKSSMVGGLVRTGSAQNTATAAASPNLIKLSEMIKSDLAANLVSASDGNALISTIQSHPAQLAEIVGPGINSQNCTTLSRTAKSNLSAVLVTGAKTKGSLDVRRVAMTNTLGARVASNGAKSAVGTPAERLCGLATQCQFLRAEVACAR